MLGFEAVSEELVSGSGYPANYFPQAALGSTSPVASRKLQSNKIANSTGGSSVALLVRSARPVRVGSTAPLSSAFEQVRKVFLGSASASGTILRGPIKIATGAQASSLFKLLKRAIFSNISSTANLTKLTNAPLSVSSITVTAKLVRQDGKIALATTTPTKSIIHAITVPIVSSIGVIASRVSAMHRALSSNISGTALIAKQSQKPLKGIASEIGSLVKSSLVPIKSLVTVAAIKGAIIFTRKTLNAISVVAIRVSKTGKAVLSSISVTARFLRGRILTAIVFVGHYFIRRITASFLSSIQVIARQVRSVDLMANAASSSSNITRRVIRKAFLSTTTPVARLVRSIGKRLLALGANSTRFARAIKHTLSGSAAAFGSIRRANKKSFLGSGAATGRLVRANRLVLLASGAAAATRKAASKAIFKASAQGAATLATGRHYARAILVPVHAFGLVARAFRRKVIASAGPTGLMRFSLARTFKASAAACATLKRFQTKHLVAIASASATLHKVYAHLQLVLARSTTIARRLFGRPLKANVNVTATQAHAHLRPFLSSIVVHAALLPLRAIIALAVCGVTALFQKLMRLVSKPGLKGSDTQPNLSGSSDQVNLTGKIE